jgi:4,5-dihydroxyphthalate decarboxylase
LPPGYRLTVVADRSLSEMLVAGDLDAVLSARAPAPFVAARSARTAPLRRVIATSSSRMRAKTGIFPIMHVVALRREIFERHRWLALNLLKAFDEARRRSLERAADMTASHFPLPWVPDELRRVRELLGGDPWPYGVDANRATLDAFLDYALEQGVCRRRLTVEALFPPDVHETFRI